jgi:hypothetical protein
MPPRIHAIPPGTKVLGAKTNTWNQGGVGHCSLLSR